jgi:hypothetical protein
VVKVVILARLPRGHQVRNQDSGFSGPAKLDRIEDNHLVPRDKDVQPMELHCMII